MDPSAPVDEPHFRIADTENNSLNELLYWSNDDGWVDAESATIFTRSERDAFLLPINGAWENI